MAEAVAMLMLQVIGNLYFRSSREYDFQISAIGYAQMMIYG